jgi:hypothetical protein
MGLKSCRGPVYRVESRRVREYRIEVANWVVVGFRGRMLAEAGNLSSGRRHLPASRDDGESAWPFILF